VRKSSIAFFGELVLQRGRERETVNREITGRDRARAKRCLECPVCGQARRRQRGIAFWFVRTIEDGLCPYCQAYERVHGRKAHEPMPLHQI